MLPGLARLVPIVGDADPIRQTSNGRDFAPYLTAVFITTLTSEITEAVVYRFVTDSTAAPEYKHQDIDDDGSDFSQEFHDYTHPFLDKERAQSRPPYLY